MEGWVFNPHKYDAKSGLPLFLDKDGKPVIDDKSGGVEYFTIGKTAGEQTPQSDPHELPVGNPDNKLAF